jgi:hypothetical protein
VKVNDKEVEYQTQRGYAIIHREWKKGDVIDYVLPMNIHRVEADSNVVADKGKVALERGPLVFCFEGIDNNNNLDNLILPDDAQLSASFTMDKFNGAEVIAGAAIAFEPSADGLSVQRKRQKVMAIPYCLWSNRGVNEMKVWIPRTISDIILSQE